MLRQRFLYRTGFVLVVLATTNTVDAVGQASGCKPAIVDKVEAQHLQLCMGINYSGSWGNSAAESFEPVAGLRYLTSPWIFRGTLGYGFKSTRDSTVYARVEGLFDVLHAGGLFTFAGIELDGLFSVRLLHDELKRDETLFTVALGPARWFDVASGTFLASLQPSFELEEYSDGSAAEETARVVPRLAVDGRFGLSDRAQLSLSGGYSQAIDDPLFDNYRLEATVSLSLETHVPGLKVVPTFAYRRDDVPPDRVRSNDYQVKIGIAYSKPGPDEGIRYVVGDLVLREAPDDDSRELRSLPDGTRLRISSCHQKWCWVQVERGEGSALLPADARPAGFVREINLSSDPASQTL